MRKRVLWTIGGFVALYIANVATVALYKAATAEQVTVLQERMASLARLDSDSDKIQTIKQLIDGAIFSSFTTSAPYAVIRRNGVIRHLRTEPHLSLGIAVDDHGPDSATAVRLLKRVNAVLVRQKFSIGLAARVKQVSIPHHSTRADMLNGVTTVFRSGSDYRIAFTAKRCRYPRSSSKEEQPHNNRLYSFGRKGITIVDGVRINDRLVQHLATDLARYATENRVERRWQSADYNAPLTEVVKSAPRRGRASNNERKLNLPKHGQRIVSLTIALDAITDNDARSYIRHVNQLFARYNITFRIEHIYQRQLRDGWRWPSELAKMQEKSMSDIYLLLTPKEWLSERSGYIRGLGNYLFGAVMVQTGTRLQTIKRIMHEFGHLFGLRHTFLKGHVMYPSERHIGLNWSPGSDRTLLENRFVTTWQAANTHPARLKLAIKLAPPMIERQIALKPTRQGSRYAGTDSWAICE